MKTINDIRELSNEDLLLKYSDAIYYDLNEAGELQDEILNRLNKITQWKQSQKESIK